MHNLPIVLYPNTKFHKPSLHTFLDIAEFSSWDGLQSKTIVPFGETCRGFRLQRDVIQYEIL